MIHYILSEADKITLMQLRDEFMPILNSLGIDIYPVKLNDGTYCLPEAIVNDSKYTDLLQILKQRNLFQNLTKREVQREEVSSNSIVLP